MAPAAAAPIAAGLGALAAGGAGAGPIERRADAISGLR